MSAGALHLIYARALCDAAAEAGRTEAVVEECVDLAELLKAQSALVDLLQQQPQGRAHAKRVLSEVFENRLSSLVFNYLRILVDNNRFDHVVPMLIAVQTVADQRSGRKQVHVTSAVALAAAQQQQLQDQLSAQLGGTLNLELSVDPALIGGLRIQVDDTVFDASVARQLDELHTQLATATMPASVWEASQGESA